MNEDVPEWMVPGAKCHQAYGRRNPNNWTGYVVAILKDEDPVQVVFKRWLWRRRRFQYWVEPMWLLNYQQDKIEPGPIAKELMYP